PHLARIFHHERSARCHLLGAPFTPNAQFSNHLASAQPSLPLYEARLARRRGRATLESDALPLLPAWISALTWRTASLRQIASMGWRAFFRMSTICRAEVSRYKWVPSVRR